MKFNVKRSAVPPIGSARRLVLTILNAPLLLVSRWLPRSSTIWTFSNRFGYSDNSRYLFEAASRSRTGDFRPIWLAQDRAEAAAVRAAGHRSYYKRELRGIHTCARAGVAVISSGLGELNRGLTGGVYVVQLWHGFPIKKILCDQVTPVNLSLRTPKTFVTKLVNVAERKAWSRPDVVVAQSDIAASRFRTAFAVDPENIAVLGTPRNDILLDEGADATISDRDVRSALLGGLPDEGVRIVLHAPTWRGQGKSGVSWASLERDAVEAVLEESNLVLVVKPHPYATDAVPEWVRSADHPRIVCMGAEFAHIGTESLLRVIDILITDYSSIAIDFAVLERPIILFAPDVEEYESTVGLYDDYKSYSGGRHEVSWQGVLRRLSTTDANRPGLEESDDLRALAHAYSDTHNCERILDEIRSRVS